MRWPPANQPTQMAANEVSRRGIRCSSAEPPNRLPDTNRVNSFLALAAERQLTGLVALPPACGHVVAPPSQSSSIWQPATSTSRSPCRLHLSTRTRVCAADSASVPETLESLSTTFFRSLFFSLSI